MPSMCGCQLRDHKHGGLCIVEQLWVVVALRALRMWLAGITITTLTTCFSKAPCALQELVRVTQVTPAIKTLADLWTQLKLVNLQHLKLVASLEAALPSLASLKRLTRLEVLQCPALQQLQVCSSLQQLQVKDCRTLHSVLDLESARHLTRLEVLQCPALQQLQVCSSLQQLQVKVCCTLHSVLSLESASHLTRLEVLQCPPLQQLQVCSSLQQLQVKD
jgi:hypothetical protein